MTRIFLDYFPIKCHRPGVHDVVRTAHQLFYLRSRGISEEEAHHMIITGWSREVIKELPFEFAMEAGQLLKVSLEGAFG